MCVCTNLLYSYIDGYLSYFHILLIVNNAALNTVRHISFLIGVFVLLDKYLGMEMMDHMVVPFLIFWGISILFSRVTEPIYIPTTVHKHAFFSTSSPTLIISCLFDNSHSSRCEVKIISIFISIHYLIKHFSISFSSFPWFHLYPWDTTKIIALVECGTFWD